MAAKITKRNALKSTTKSTAAARMRAHFAALGVANENAYLAWCRAQGFSACLHKTWRQQEREAQCARRLANLSQAEFDRAQHIRALGLGGLAEYETWCREHDFSLSLRKSETQKAQERQAIHDAQANRAMQQARRYRRHPDTLIQAIYDGRANWPDLKTYSQQKVKMLFNAAQPKPRARESLLRLLQRVWPQVERTGLGPVIPHLGVQPGNTLLDGLFALALRHRDWIRPLEDWKPSLRDGRGWFGELARHLLARYAVPGFLDAAWFEGDTPQARQHQQWFLHVGGGGNIRYCDLPLPLTKMGAHYALQAPRDLPIMAALRWGQARGMGANAGLALAIANTRLADAQADEAFWASVALFFVQHPTLERAELASMVEYIYSEKYQQRGNWGPNGVVQDIGPANPNFTLKGRTPESLRWRVAEWKAQQAFAKSRPHGEWARLGVEELRMEQTDARDSIHWWTIQELLSSRELMEEGKAMRNCVATYVDECQSGSSAIWSVRVKAAGETQPRRVMTVEIAPGQRAIVQAKGRCNVEVSDDKASPRLQQAAQLLKRWAAEHGLTIAQYVW